MPFEMLGAFVVGASLCAFIAPLRRAHHAKGDGRAARSTRPRAPRSTISASRRRTGARAFSSSWRCTRAPCVLVPDAAVDKKALLELAAPKAAIEAPSRRADLDAFLKALETSTPPLEKAMPRKAGDENELPDEPE